MKLPYAEPDPAGSERAKEAKRYRDLATEISRLHPQAKTQTNCEESDHDKYPANFTKGLLHDCYGVIDDPADYRCFVEAINSRDRNLFEKHVPTANGTPFHCSEKEVCGGKKREKKKVEWRGWESPRAGHVYEPQGLDSGACGMAPAPRVGSSELTAEMAEVYALAILRDVPFTTICRGGSEKLCPSGEDPGNAELSASKIVELLNGMDFFNPKSKGRCSSTPHNVGDDGFNRFERHRREARTFTKDGKPDVDGKLTTDNAFRGSTKGAHIGPYISQFMLVGARSIACAGGGAASYPALDAAFDAQDGYIPYGSLIIDQRTITHKNCLDYMTDWWSWLDVQNGADFRGSDVFEETRRFITTPRDLATYVHYDALYEAYLNACLIMLANGVPGSKGFPEKSPSGTRTPFATFGGPHILSLVTEVATRCLKAVRRQKFNYHRRARPEAIGGRLTLACLDDCDYNEALGCAKDAFEKTLNDLPKELRDAIKIHNKAQNSEDMAAMRHLHCDDKHEGWTKGWDKKKWSQDEFDDCNLLLPMAFPEGSPMHPAYGAGHATVAGGCVTMLKAFFEMFEDCDSYKERCFGHAYVPNKDGSRLINDPKFKGKLTIQGELDKLAANISIGRNMAGVHYYSDYYDSLRMGERIAVSIVMEQAPSYGDAVESTFKSFDGDYVTISGEVGSCPSLSVIDRHGDPVDPRDWWLRHVAGEEQVEDL